MNEILQKISKDNIDSLLSNIKMTDQLERDFMKKHDMEPIEKYICECLLFQHSPMIYIQGLQKESLGTSIYIQYNDQKYILTAGHVFTGGRPASEDSPNKLDFSKFFIGNGISFKDFKSGIICPPLEEANYQEWDYALLVVDNEIAQTLDQCYTPFQITPNTNNEGYSPQYGFLYGYPVSKNKSNRFKKKADTDAYVCIRTPLDLLFSFQNQGENIGFTCNRKVATIGEIRKNQM